MCLGIFSGANNQTAIVVLARHRIYERPSASSLLCGCAKVKLSIKLGIFLREGLRGLKNKKSQQQKLSQCGTRFSKQQQAPVFAAIFHYCTTKAKEINYENILISHEPLKILLQKK